MTPSDTGNTASEEDHLVSLELGGSPTNPHNLWPEPHHVIGGWGSYTKDRLEDRLHTLVCHGRVPLAQAQHDIASDWIAAYKRYVGPDPSPGRRHHRRRADLAQEASPTGANLIGNLDEAGAATRK